MEKIIKPTIILAIIAFVATFALSHVKEITYPNILKQDQLKQQSALDLALPGYSIKEEKKAVMDNGDFIYWIGEKTENNTTVRGYAFIAEKNGYSGSIRSIAGVDEKGTIIGISIMRQSETPGLGARCIEIASRESFWQHFFGRSDTRVEPGVPWFQDQFAGLNSNNKIEIHKRGDWNPEMRQELLSKNGISAITGATITTKAVKDSIEAGIKKLHKALEAAGPATEVQK